MERPDNNQPPYRCNTNIGPPIHQPPQQPQSSNGGNTVQSPPPAHLCNLPPYGYSTNIMPPINQPPQQPQSSNGGNTVQSPPPAHMYSQPPHWYNSNNAPCNSQLLQSTQFSHVGNTARLPVPALLNNQYTNSYSINSVPWGSQPIQPTQFSYVGNTARLPPPAHMNYQPHPGYNTKKMPWNSQHSQPPIHGADTAMPTPPASLYTQHSHSYSTSNVSWNSQPPQPPVHGANTAMPTPPTSVQTQHSYGYITNNVPQKSHPLQKTQSIHGVNSATQGYMGANGVNNQYPVLQSQMYPAARIPQPVPMGQNSSNQTLPAPSSVQSHALQSQSSSVMTQGQGQLHVTSPSVFLLPAQQSQCQQSLPVSASQSQTSCHTSPSASVQSALPQPSMPSSGGSSTVSGQLTSCQNHSTPSTSVMASSSSQGQPLPGSSQTTGGCSLAPLQNHIQASLDFWLQCVNEWYPDRHKKTYFLPHLFFRKTQHSIAAIDHLGNLPVLVPEVPPKRPKLQQVPLYPPSLSQTHPTFPVAGSVFTLPHSEPAPLPRFIETDVVDDDAAERLWRCLRVLSKEHREVMMVISQLDFRKYLDNDTDPINTAKNAAACANLPRPGTMQQQQHQDGDFDVLIIHRHHGLIVCEVKAVGADRRNTSDLNKAVVGKVQRAVKQLNKAKDVLNHLVSDMVPVRVTKTLVLPNVTSAELLLALNASCHLQQDLNRVEHVHKALSTACRLKQALSSVPSLQPDCSSLKIPQHQICVAKKLKQELDRACHLQQELNIACRLQHDLTIIHKIQQELDTACKLQEELDNVCQLQQDVGNITELQKELTTACTMQNNVSGTSQLQATPGSAAHLQVQSTASELTQVLTIILQRLQKLGKGSQLHDAVGKSVHLQQVLSNISQLQQELSNTSQPQQSLSATSQLHLLLTNVSRLHQPLSNAFLTQQNTGSVSQLQELLDTVSHLQWRLKCASQLQDKLGIASELQKELSTASHLPQTLSSVLQLQQELNSVSQLQQTHSHASELQQELDLTNEIQQALCADRRLQRAPEITDELQAALRSICQLRQELMATSQLQQELDIVSRLQQKFSVTSQTQQAPSGSLLPRPELSILSQLHQALDTAAQKLQEVFTACQQGQLWQDLCTCLDAKDISEAITRCLCADQIPSDADLESMCNQGNNQPTSGASTSSSQTSASPTFPLLSSWWQNMTSQGAGPDPQMSDTVYDKLLARFCGPATTVEVPTVTAPRKAMAKPGKYTPARKVVRTEGEAVAETGLILSLLALYPDQVDLLSDNTLRCVHLRGPPGTGKTIVLVLKAIQWLHQGHDVHVVSGTTESSAVSILIERQLQCVLGPNPAPGFGTVHRHVDDVNKLAALASDGELYVIADEVFEPTDYGWVTDNTDFEKLINELHIKIPSLSVWCASVQRLHSPPSWMCERQLTTPLRCPPAVTKEVAKSKEMKGSAIPSYSSTPAPTATEGPPVRWLPHKGGQDGHTKGTAMKCDVCGDAVVQLLKELGVGQSSGPDSLQYRDVLVLGPSKRVMSRGNSSKRADKGLTGKLLASGIPVQILTQADKDTKLHGVALGLKNEVTVSDYMTVSGLERRVVIGTGSSSDQADLKNRLLAMSRCTAQLAWIGDITQR